MAKKDLEDRFDRFARQLPCAEAIDDLAETLEATGPRADYLWRDRTVVVELKTLTADPQGKINQVFSELSQRPDFPLFVGHAPMDKVLRHVPDGDEISRKVGQKVMRSVESAFRSAKHQVANTRVMFNCPDALGLLVVLNEDVETLEPQDLVRELSRLMELRQGETRGIDAVWVLTEAHRMSNAHPCLLITGSTVDRLDWATDYLDSLTPAWAKFNNSPLINRGYQETPDLSVDPKGPRPGERAPKHEHWRARYRANRYLDALDDAAVIAHGQKVFVEFMPYTIKGGPRPPMHEIAPVFIRLTEFIEEASLRGLNMRGFGTGMELPPELARLVAGDPADKPAADKSQERQRRTKKQARRRAKRRRR